MAYDHLACLTVAETLEIEGVGARVQLGERWQLLLQVMSSDREGHQTF